jgi:hypothetical protein
MLTLCQSMLSAAAAMMMQADAISSFVAAQRNRTQRTATKSAWGVAAQQLSAER